MLMDAVTGGALGGITGLAGSALTGWLNHKENKDKRAHDVAMAKEDRETIKAEAEAGVQIENVKLASTIEQGEATAFTESLKSANKALFNSDYAKHLPSWAMGIIAVVFAGVDVLRASVRPVVTYYLMYVSTKLGVEVYRRKPELFMAQAADLVGAISYLTVTCVTWWFADRRLSKAMAAKHK
jgi:hypothetical protein